MKAPHVRKVGSEWKFSFQASFATCPHIIGEDMKLWLQVTLNTWHSPQWRGSFYSWLVTCQASIGEFFINLQIKSLF